MANQNKNVKAIKQQQRQNNLINQIIKVSKEMASKLKNSVSSKRSRTQSNVNSAFDESVVFIAVTKIQKCLYDISKSKYDKINQAIKVINKDVNVITEESRDKQKVILLGTHLIVFEMINDKKYNEALQIVTKKESHINEKGNPILKLSLKLLRALILRFLEKQEESHKVLNQAIQQVELSGLKIKSKTLDYKILQCTLICISIIADHFNEFESHSQQFRSIYAKAYHISHKYLTQYHKLTQTLFSICKKFPKKQDSSRQKQYKMFMKRSSLNIDSNRSSIKHSKSDRIVLDENSKSKHIDHSYSSNLQMKQSLKKPKPKRLRTLDAYIDLQQSKQKCLSKLYGIELTESKIKQKKLFKRPRLSTSLRTSNRHDEPSQMKDLQSISQIYLPKIEPQRKKQEKLNAADIILKYAMSLQKLKPNYFDKLSKKPEPKNQTIKKDTQISPNKPKPITENKQIQNDVKKHKPEKQQQKPKEKEKEKPLPPIKPQQELSKKDDQSCQLI